MQFATEQKIFEIEQKYLKTFTLSCSSSKFSIKERNNGKVEQKHSCQLSNIYIDTICKTCQENMGRNVKKP